jgi:hypothetical protein
MAYDISVGVRKDDPQLRARIDRLLTAHKAEVARLLASYGMPVSPGA